MATSASGYDIAGARVLFYAGVDDPQKFQTVGFYRHDIEALEALGCDVTTAATLREVIDARPDLYFIWWWTRALPITVVARIRKRPALITGTFNWESTPGHPGFLVRPPWQRAAIRRAAHLAARNLFVSQHELDLVGQGLGLTNGTYFPHQVDCVDGCRYSASPSPLPEPLAHSPFILQLAWTGRHNLSRKCTYEVIAAFELLAPRHPSLRLVLAGNEGDGHAELRTRCASSPVADRIDVLGLVTESTKHRLLSSAVVYVSPSRFEGFGLAIAEAAAHGVPVVTSAAGAVPEVLNGHAIYCEPKSPPEIAAGIERALEAAPTYDPRPAIEHLRQFGAMAKRKRMAAVLRDVLGDNR